MIIMIIISFDLINSHYYQVIELGISSKCSFNHIEKTKVLKNNKEHSTGISGKAGPRAQTLLKQVTDPFINV